MRKTILAVSTLALGMIAVAAPAQAGCNDVTCTLNSSHSHDAGYAKHSGSTHGYSSGYTSSMSAPCPSKSSRGADGLCLSNTSSYTHYSSTVSMPEHSPHIVPFTGHVSSFSNAHLEGLGSNERLSPTECPVSVYNPQGGKVLGCYSVVKPKPRPIVRTQVHYNTVRVVRPIVYVRYPVPVAVPVMRPTCNTVTQYSRYGGHWPRGGCGW